MHLMEKDGHKKYVPDAFVEKYRSEGYHVVGEDVPSSPSSALDNEGSSENTSETGEEADSQKAPDDHTVDEVPEKKPGKKPPVGSKK